MGFWKYTFAFLKSKLAARIPYSFPPRQYHDPYYNNPQGSTHPSQKPNYQKHPDAYRKTRRRNPTLELKHPVDPRH